MSIQMVWELDELDEMIGEVVHTEKLENENRITIANPIEYAVFLEAREGFDVFPDEAMIEKVSEYVKLAINEPGDFQKNIEQGLEAGGWNFINWARDHSATYGVRPPVRSGEVTASLIRASGPT